MRDYSEWNVILDYESYAPHVNPNRPWLKHRSADAHKSIRFDPIPVHELIRLSASQYPNNVCVYHKPTDKKYTYRELLNFADKVANALNDMGIGKESGVGIMSGNCPEFIFSLLGILETGAMVIPINPLLKESDVIHIINESGNVNTVFCHKDNWSTIRRARKKVNIKNIILLGTAEAKQDTATFEEFIEGKIARRPEVDIDPMSDIAALLFTGGTTGLPKGVILTHNNLVSDSLAIFYNSDEPLEKMKEVMGATVVLSILPLCHSFGFITLITALYAAEMLVMLGSFDPFEVLEAIEYYRVPLFVGVPVMYQMLINCPDFTERDLSSIEGSVSSSAALAPELAKRWEEVVGTKIGQGYGLTEASPGTHLPTEWLPEVKPESVGAPIMNTDAKIVNPETLEELAIGEIGEILINGPQVMKGYWKQPEATRKDIVNGWLRTGDLARMDEDGYFYIEGRTKDMIKYKGYKVMPKDVEERLYEHPAILEVGVVGIPDPNIGETIKAFVVLRKEFQDKTSEQDIIGWAKENMAGYKYPRQVEFLKALPRTVIGKVYRKKLRERDLKKEEKPVAPL